MERRRKIIPKMLNKKVKNISVFDTGKLQSEVIDFLRFPLTIGVVLIHNSDPTVRLAADRIGNDTWPPLFTFCSDLFSQTLASLSVPTFFFISGFLFFLHCEKFDTGSYLKKLKNRIRTLLVPYLFWNILSLSVFFIAYHTPVFFPFFGKTYHFTWQYVLQSLWALPSEQEGVMNYPCAGQFWFIRDLMVMVTFSPILYYFVKKFGIGCVILLGLLWFAEWWQVWLPWLAGHGLSITAMFFFTSGAWFAINDRNIVNDAGRVASVVFILYPLLVFADLLTKQHIPDQSTGYLPVIHNSGILVGMAVCFALAAQLLKTGKMRRHAFLASASFFIFAAHKPLFLNAARKAVFVIFQPQSDVALTINFFLLMITVATTLLGAYWLLQRAVPKFTRVITGGR